MLRFSLSILALASTAALADVQPPAGFTSARTTSAEVNLHYVRDGGPGEVVVLPHGFPQTFSSWNRMMPLLSADYDVIAPDLRGVGASDKPAGGYDKKTSAVDVKNLLDELGIDKANIVGHDIGEMMKPLATTVEGQTLDSGHWITESVPEETVALLDAFFKKY